MGPAGEHPQRPQMCNNAMHYVCKIPKNVLNSLFSSDQRQRYPRLRLGAFGHSVAACTPAPRLPLPGKALSPSILVVWGSAQDAPLESRLPLPLATREGGGRDAPSDGERLARTGDV